MQCSKLHSYSITSSALASRVGGTARPSIIAVAKLMKSSNLVDCTTPSRIGAVFEALSAQSEAKRDRHEGCGCTDKL
jgi:hypothetical protein